VAVTIPQVEASRPEALVQSAGELGYKASGLSSQIDKQRTTLDGLRNGWEGTASNAALAKATPMLLRMEQIHGALTQAQSDLHEGGTQLTQTRARTCPTGVRTPC
jgi:WXG100 family type VII secretion target